MKEPWRIFAGVYGFLGVGMGAFGAHALKSSFPEDLLRTFDTGSRYCLVHAVVLLGMSVISKSETSSIIRRAGWFFVVGTAIFSGTLWMLVLSGQRWLGAITPVGGVLLLFGWLSLIWSGIRKGEQ